MKIKIFCPDHETTRAVITWAMGVLEPGPRPGKRPFDFTVHYDHYPCEVIGMDVPSVEWATFIALQFPVTVDVST